MNWMQSSWLIAVTIGAAVLVALAYTLRRRRPTRSTPAVKAAWLVGAATSGTLLVSIAAKVIEILPNATVVDVGALAITGVLTGLFLAFGLMPTDAGAQGR